MKRPITFFFVLLAFFCLQNSAHAGVKDELKEGNYALFEDARFKLRGNYSASGVYFYERDLNGFNGNLDAWDSYMKDKVPAQTKEIERWFFHEITLEPSVNFFDDAVNFHTKLYAGGYQWTRDFSGTVVYNSYDKPDDEFRSEPINMEKIYLKEAFLEALTPYGLFLVGRLPGNNHGIIYGIKLPPLPNWSFAYGYLKKNEGSYPVIDEKDIFLNNMDTRYFDDYQDRDDQTIHLLSARFDNEQGLKFGFTGAQAIGGSHSPKFTELDVTKLMFKLDYNKSNWHIHLFACYTDAMIARLTKNFDWTGEYDESGDKIYEHPSGTLLQTLIDTVGDTVEMLDKDRYAIPTLQVDDIRIKPGVSFAGNIAYDISKLTPEIGFLYAPGGKKWYEGNHSIPDDEDLPGNSSEKKVLKDYLLNEIEDKYFSLISPFGMVRLSLNGIDEFSYHNMKAVKFGGTYRINDKLEFFGQVLRAWRTDVSYFEKDYWDSFFITYTYPTRLTYLANELNNAQAYELPVVLQLNDVTYHQKVDDLIGTEYDARLTWFAKPGLEISIIGAFFQMGGFYRDILTPKKYVRQMVYRDNSLDKTASLGNPETIYGPYQGSKEYDPADAWTLQLKFEFKFQ